MKYKTALHSSAIQNELSKSVLQPITLSTRRRQSYQTTRRKSHHKINNTDLLQSNKLLLKQYHHDQKKNKENDLSRHEVSSYFMSNIIHPLNLSSSGK